MKSLATFDNRHFIYSYDFSKSEGCHTALRHRATFLKIDTSFFILFHLYRRKAMQNNRIQKPASIQPLLIKFWFQAICKDKAKP